MKKPERQSPGFKRMRERLGEEAAEKMRLNTLKQQEEARAAINSVKSKQDALSKSKQRLTEIRKSVADIVNKKV